MMKSRLPVFLLTALAFIGFPTPIFSAEKAMNLEESIHRLSLQFVFAAAVLIAIIVILTYVIKNEGERLKTIFFVLIAGSTVVVTVFLIGSTLFLNTSSVTGGPVHWHADFEIYHCGKEVDLVNPRGFSNKVGTATFHEHNDKRIHVEGVVINHTDVNVGTFFQVVGGNLTQTSLLIPTTQGELLMRNGDICPDGTEAELQGFVYRVEGQNIVRNKLYDLPNYQLSPHGSVPPGDCIIIEFGRTLSRTEHICESYELAILKGKFNYGN